MSKYPEHDKLSEVSDKSQVCGEFLEWLQGGYEGSPSPSIQLCVWREASDLPRWLDSRTGEPTTFAHRRAVENPDWHPAGYYTPGMNTKDLLGAFFGIDNEKVEQEKKAMLAEIREMNEV